MISPAKRLIVLASAISLIAACASPTEPTASQLKPISARFDGDSVCRTGWINPNGRCE